MRSKRTRRLQPLITSRGAYAHHLNSLRRTGLSRAAVQQLKAETKEMRSKRVMSTPADKSSFFVKPLEFGLACGLSQPDFGDTSNLASSSTLRPACTPPRPCHPHLPILDPATPHLHDLYQSAPFAQDFDCDSSFGDGPISDDIAASTIPLDDIFQSSGPNAPAVPKTQRQTDDALPKHIIERKTEAETWLSETLPMLIQPFLEYRAKSQSGRLPTQPLVAPPRCPHAKSHMVSAITWHSKQLILMSIELSNLVSLLQRSIVWTLLFATAIPFPPRW